MSTSHIILTNKSSMYILIADDDSDDRNMIKDAFVDNHIPNSLGFVENGEELINYLKRKGQYADELEYPLPAIILLDLNMPKMDGREVLKVIKNDQSLKWIPVIVLTTSKLDEDIVASYNLGVNGFIIKPSAYTELLHIVKTLSHYWLETVQLPITS